MATDIVSIACEPPLGTVTTLRQASIQFNVAVESKQAGGIELGAAIWHDAHGHWADLPLVQSTPNTWALKDVSLFTGRLDLPNWRPSTTHFTLKITIGGSLVWANDVDPQSDGVVIVQALERAPLTKYFAELDDSWRVQHLTSHNDGVDNCALTHELEAEKTVKRIVGRPKDTLKWFAIVRHSTPWIGPRQGDDRISLDKPAILLVLLFDDGMHVALCPENGEPHTLSLLESDDDGRLVLSTRNDGEIGSTARVRVAISQSHEDAIAAVLAQAPERDDHRSSTSTYGAELDTWYDGLGYCTWNGIGRELTEDKIIAALKTLRDNGLVIPNLIIDDNWQSLDNTESGDPNDYRWTSFEANEEHFPKGLAHAIKGVRAAHPHLQHVAVWHGTFGYWGGFSPAGELAKSYKMKEVKTQTHLWYMNGDSVMTVAGEDVHRMYDDFYRFLASCGIDSVKADVGYYPEYVDGTAERRELIYSYQDAFLTASGKHFHHRAISCMSQTPQVLFHSFGNTSKSPPYLMRNSDDFAPDMPDSHAWHIFCNTHNSVLTQHLNVLPDWDMFQTAGPFPYMHAVARCLSGGPIYITDEPGQHDVDLIRQMTATGFDGALKILRPETVGRAVEIFHEAHGRRFVRLLAEHQGVSFLGMFNLGDSERVELVTLGAMVKGPSTSYLVRSYFAGESYVLKDAHEYVPVKLRPQGAHEILTAYPIERTGDVEIAVLGLLGKMTGAAVLLAKPNISVEAGHVQIEMRIKSLGRLGIWVGNGTAENLLASASTTVIVGDQEYRVDIRHDSKDSVIALDVEAALKGSSAVQMEGMRSLMVRVKFGL